MAGIRINELPKVEAFGDDDVIVLNENNLETSQIGMSYFVTTLTGRDLKFTGLVELQNDVVVGGKTYFNNVVEFNDGVTHNNPVDFNDEISFNGATSGVLINDLDDVDTTTTPPVVGDALLWDNLVNSWVPGRSGSLNSVVEDISPQLGGDLDVNSFKIISTFGDSVIIESNNDVLITPGGANNAVNLGGRGTVSSELRFYGAETLRYVGIQAPAESDLSSYTLILPSSPGQLGQALLTDGSGNLAWGNVVFGDGTGGGGGIQLADLSVRTESASGGGELTYNDLNGEFIFNPAYLEPYFTQTEINALSITELVDVDTTTNEAQSGQTLIWDEINDNWIPGNVNIESSSLNDLLDVSAPVPSNGQILVYNGFNNQWQSAENEVPNALTFQGSCNITQITSSDDNDDVQDNVSDRLTGYFWVNGTGNIGPVDPTWDGLTADSIGGEYIAWTENDEFVVLGRTGDLNAVLEVAGGTGIVIDDSDQQIPIINLADTAVTPGDYDFPIITVDQQGRITNVTSGSQNGGNIDTILLDYLELAGGTLTGKLFLAGDPETDLEASTKKYVDLLEYNILGDPFDFDDTGVIGDYVKKTGSHMYGDLTFSEVRAPNDGTPNPSEYKLKVEKTTGNIDSYGTVTAVDFIRRDGSSVGGSTEISDQPPLNPTPGDFWFNSENGVFYVYYEDADSLQWVSIAGGGGGGDPFEMSMIKIDQLDDINNAPEITTTSGLVIITE